MELFLSFSAMEPFSLSQHVSQNALKSEWKRRKNAKIVVNWSFPDRVFRAIQ
jgi:hypothetical protein